MYKEYLILSTKRTFHCPSSKTKQKEKKTDKNSKWYFLFVFQSTPLHSLSFDDREKIKEKKTRTQKAIYVELYVPSSYTSFPLPLPLLILLLTGFSIKLMVYCSYVPCLLCSCFCLAPCFCPLWML